MPGKSGARVGLLACECGPNWFDRKCRGIQSQVRDSKTWRKRLRAQNGSFMFDSSFLVLSLSLSLCFLHGVWAFSCSRVRYIYIPEAPFHTRRGLRPPPSHLLRALEYTFPFFPSQCHRATFLRLCLHTCEKERTSGTAFNVKAS